MIIETEWGNRGTMALGALGLVLLGCSGLNHDCVERRDCPSPKVALDAGGDEWWNTGSGGQFQGSAGAADSGAAGALGESPIADASDRSSGSAAAAQQDPPRLLTLSPANGALGVANDAHIELNFDRAMDTTATEAAYHSTDLPAAELTFTWNDEHTSLTLTPRTPLHYARTDDDPNANARPLLYGYGFDAGARDEHGRAMLAVELAFSTLRERSFELAADPQRTGNWTDAAAEGVHNCLRQAKAPYVPTVCVGDDASNARYTGFLSFDLRALPSNIAQFSSATLSATGSSFGFAGELGESRLEQVAFGELDRNALVSASVTLLGSFYSAAAASEGAPFELNADVTRAVADDYAQRVLRADQSQYRLGFAKVLANRHWDDIELPTASIRLLLVYLVP